MRYAVVRNGIVENVIVADSEFAATLEGAIALSDSQICAPGWLYDNGELHPPPVVAKADIAGLVAEFQFPGNVLYTSVIQKVATSDFQTQDHWANLKLLLNSVGSEEAIAAGIHYLAQLLQQSGHPLSAEDVAAWNELRDRYNLPNGCKL